MCNKVWPLELEQRHIKWIHYQKDKIKEITVLKEKRRNKKKQHWINLHLRQLRDHIFQSNTSLVGGTQLNSSSRTQQKEERNENLEGKSDSSGGLKIVF